MRLKKTAETLKNLGYDNEKIYNYCRKALSEIEDIDYDISLDDDIDDIISSIENIEGYFSTINDEISSAKSNGQDNEDSLYEGNIIIEHLNDEIQSTLEEIQSIKDSIDEFSLNASKSIRLKKVAKRFICHIHDEIMEYCEGAINKCSNTRDKLSTDLTKDELEEIINDFDGDINHACSWINDLIDEAEDSNERMSRGIYTKNDMIDELSKELDDLLYELGELQSQI